MIHSKEIHDIEELILSTAQSPRTPLPPDIKVSTPPDGSLLATPGENPPTTPTENFLGVEGKEGSAPNNEDTAKKEVLESLEKAEERRTKKPLTLGEGVFKTAEDVLQNKNTGRKIRHITDVLAEQMGLTPPYDPGKSSQVESIHGADDRQRISVADFTPAKQTCYLEIILYNGAVGYATGWMVRSLKNRLCMTAGHVVYYFLGWSQYIRVIPGSVNATSQPYGSEVSSQFVAPSQYVDDWNLSYDYGGIILPTTTLQGRVGSLGYKLRKSIDLMNLPAFTLGYPADKPAGTLWSVSGYMESPSSTFLRYYLDTYPGQSGSPILLTNGVTTGNQVVGIHTRGGTPNLGVRFRSSTINQIRTWGII